MNNDVPDMLAGVAMDPAELAAASSDRRDHRLAAGREMQNLQPAGDHRLADRQVAEIWMVASVLPG